MAFELDVLHGVMARSVCTSPDPTFALDQSLDSVNLFSFSSICCDHLAGLLACSVVLWRQVQQPACLSVPSASDSCTACRGDGAWARQDVGKGRSSCICVLHAVNKMSSKCSSNFVQELPFQSVCAT